MLGSTIPLKSLALICRSMATMMKSGVPIVRTVATVSIRIGGPGCQRRMQNVADRLKMGEDVRSAFASQQGYFPDLFVDMVSVAEETGALPEVLLSLADHYENLVRMRREFIGQITLPIMQFVAAVTIISFVIYVMGILAENRNETPTDIFGFGLVGTRGAIVFFFGTFGIIGALIFLYMLIAHGMGKQPFFHGVFLQIPVIGPCLRAFAISRFSWAFALTQQAGMRIVPSLQSSMKATANYAFIAAIPRMTGLVKQGEDLSTVLADSGLFPLEYEQMVQVAETSGTVPEMLEHLSPQFEESARRALRALAIAVGWLVWALVAGFIIVGIFSLFKFYINMLDQAGKM